MSKYIDLAEQIVDDSHAHRQSIFSDDARVVLRWLDDHADQVRELSQTAEATVCHVRQGAPKDIRKHLSIQAQGRVDRKAMCRMLQAKRTSRLRQEGQG